MYMDKQTFVANLREWLNLDTESRTLWEKTKEIRMKKKELCSKIHEYVEFAGMKKTRIDIPDGSLRFIDKTEYGTLSMKYIEECLAKFMEEEDVNTIMAYIKENRTSKITNEIKRTYNVQETNLESSSSETE